MAQPRGPVDKAAGAMASSADSNSASNAGVGSCRSQLAGDRTIAGFPRRQQACSYKFDVAAREAFQNNPAAASHNPEKHSTSPPTNTLSTIAANTAHNACATAAATIANANPAAR